jgi:alkylhydroperoxidase family enzyme
VKRCQRHSHEAYDAAHNGVAHPHRCPSSKDEEFSASKAAGYTDQQLVDISLAIAVTVFTNVFNRIHDTAIDFPAVA